MCIFSSNSRTFWVSAMGVNGFCMVILLLPGSSTSSMFIYRGNSRPFGVAAVDAYGFFVVILVVSGPSTSSMFIFPGNCPVFWESDRRLTGLRGNSRSFRLFNFFDVHFSW